MRENTPDYNRPPPPRPGSDQPQELWFEDEDTRRIGDQLPPDETDRASSVAQGREAGLAGAASPDRDVTEDDLSPGTLLGEESEQLPADQTLREVGADQIGGGVGLDEEEQALLDRPDIDLQGIDPRRDAPNDAQR